MDRETKNWLLKYIKHGWFLFPVSPLAKKPLISKNLERASNNFENLETWYRRFPDCNWGVSLAKSGLVCVDVDKPGLLVWEFLTNNNGDPQTLIQQSGSGVGKHYVFKAKPNAKYRGKLEDRNGNKLDGIDVKHNGYICVAPSKHKSGNRYNWVNSIIPKDIPDWLSQMIEKIESPIKLKSNVYETVGVRQYVDLIEKLKQKPLNYDEWISCGQALYSIFSGDETGLNLWLILTDGASYKDGDLDLAKDKWNGFSVGPRQAGTLFHVAKQKGVDIPNLALEIDKIAFAQNAIDKKLQEKKVDWFEDGLGRLCTVSQKTAIDYFNNAGYAVLTGKNEGTIVKTWIKNKIRDVTTLEPKRFAISNGDRFYKKYKTDGEFKLISAFDLWFESSKKTTYSNIVFKPTALPTELNLWSNIPCQALPGSCSGVLYFIREILCRGDKTRFEYLLDWCAHLVQKPWEKSTIVPVLIGEQGTGKGLFTDGLMCGILSKSFYIRLDKPGIITERFNVEQSRKFLTVLDESSWRGYHELSNVLKSLTGNDTMTVEEKFGSRYTIENYSRYIITSNDIEAVKIETSNRRYLVLELNDVKKDINFYGKLWDGIKNGHTCNHFYHFLVNRNIEGFSPFAFPKHLDSDGMSTKLKSLGNVGQFWCNLLLFEPRPVFFKNWNGLYILNKDTCYREYVDFCKVSSLRGASNVHFWIDTYRILPDLKKMECRSTNDMRARAVKMGPSEIRDLFCKRLNIANTSKIDDIEYLPFGASVASEDDF